MTSKRPAHRPSRKSEIVQAAIEVYAQQGPHASIAEIADACGMSQASIYYHYASREELLAAAVDESAHRMERHTKESSTSTTADAVRVVWDWAAKHPLESKLLFVWSAPGAGPVREARQRMVSYYTRIALKRIPHRNKESAVTAAANTLAARTYVTNAVGISEEWNAGRTIGGVVEREEIVEALVDVSQRVMNIK